METLFTTERLIVRRLVASDVAPLLSVYGDADAMRWVGDGRPLDRTQCERWLAVTEENYRLRGYGMSAILDRDSEEVVGFCGLVHPGGQRDAEVKYALQRSFWGRGFATEAVRGMLAYGADSLRLTTVIATVDPANAASHRVLEKAGMRPTELRANEDGTSTQVYVWTPDG